MPWLCRWCSSDHGRANVFSSWCFYFLQIVVQLASCVWLLVTPWTVACQASLFSPSPGVCPSSCPLHQWCHPTISSSVFVFSFCLQSFPASGSFSMSWIFTSDGWSTGASASASILPMNIQGWFPLRLTGLISLLCKGLASSPAPQFKSINSSVLCLLYGPALTTVRDYWKGLDHTDLCWQTDVSTF